MYHDRIITNAAVLTPYLLVEALLTDDLIRVFHEIRQQQKFPASQTNFFPIFVEPTAFFIQCKRPGYQAGLTDSTSPFISASSRTPKGWSLNGNSSESLRYTISSFSARVASRGWGGCSGAGAAGASSLPFTVAAFPPLLWDILSRGWDGGPSRGILGGWFAASLLGGVLRGGSVLGRSTLRAGIEQAGLGIFLRAHV